MFDACKFGAVRRRADPKVSSPLKTFKTVSTAY
jgi:hypothetical protein